MPICTLQFVTEHGDVPEVVADGSLLADSTGDVGTGSIDVFSDGSKTSSSCGSLKSVKGDTESEECSNRGLCDRNSGLCTCFAGYGASDGKGNAGSVPDCGYRVGSDVNKDGLPSVYKVSGESSQIHIWLHRVQNNPALLLYTSQKKKWLNSRQRASK